jgi:hypothetical protein
MKRFRLHPINVVLLSLPIALWIFILSMWIRILALQYGEEEIINLYLLGMMILLSMYMIVISILNILTNRVIVSEEDIVIEGIDTKLVLGWNDLDGIIESQLLFGNIEYVLKLKKKVQLYNRGLLQYILFWYKINTIPLSQYKKELIHEIKIKINI